MNMVFFNALLDTGETCVVSTWQQVGQSTCHTVEGHLAVDAAERVEVVPLVYYVVLEKCVCGYCFWLVYNNI
jgi:hypothetical protein